MEFKELDSHAQFNSTQDISCTEVTLASVTVRNQFFMHTAENVTNTFRLLLSYDGVGCDKWDIITIYEA